MQPSVVVDRDFQILYVHGKTGKYLQFPEGELSNSLVKAAREELRLALSSALAQATAQNREIDKEGLQIKVNGDTAYVNLKVKPVQEDGPARLVVAFEDVPARKKRSRSIKPKEEAGNINLEEDLQLTRESLRSTIEELETANEELRSANEEYQSTNEELNSANEELETSREELQSINEELTTVNTEYQKNMEEMSTIADDMKNLLNNTGIATLFLDRSARIKRYTPAATEILNIIATDIGRPIEHVTSVLVSYNMAEAVKKVLDTLMPVSQDVQTKDGRWYSVRVHPYSTADNTIAGVVVSFLDIKQGKSLEKELNSILDTLRESVLVLDSEFRIIAANRRFYQVFKATPENSIGKLLYQFGEHQWDISELRRLLEVVLPNNTQFEDFPVERDFPGIGMRKMLLNARQIFNDQGATQKILLALDDVTDLKPMSS
jgi:two-component system CheB/CheR fusion protein